MYLPAPRRGTLTIRAAVAAVLALVATGCGSTEEASTEPAATATSEAGSGLLPAAEGGTEYPLTLTSREETVLQERPERIAVIGFSTGLDMLEVLDVTPVYALTDLEWEWRDPAYLEGIELVDTATRRDPVNAEQIAAVQPDLIIAMAPLLEDVDYDRLSGIAPVLEGDPGAAGDQIDWREQQREVGEALDLADAAEQAIDDADAAIADVAAEHPEFAGATLTIATEYSSGVEYYTVAGGTAETFATDLGFEPNPLAEQFVAAPQVSDELLPSLDADALVVCYLDQATREAREAQTLFGSIPAVAEGRYHAVVADEEGSGGNAIWVMRRGASALSLPWAAEVLADVWLADVGLTD